MLTKDIILREFQKDPKKHWEVELFRQKGYVRKQCESCKKFFWTLDTERKNCADSGCEPYGFINKIITKKKWDYIETWKNFEKFFINEGHASIPRYPVIDRIRPDLYFTIASIQDFQRLDNGNMAFVYPANPLIVPQICLRFVDIPSVGLSGRHLTSFVMPGQHAFGYPNEGYFKDRCIELNFGFLNGVMKIPESELVYTEDIWAMPDFSAFGPCIETFSKGLELVNHVFMQFQKSGDSFKELGIKVNDTGWGHERLVWFSNGTNTIYECTFGDIINKLKKQSGVNIESEVFAKFSRLAGALDIEQVSAANAKKIREEIAKKIGVPLNYLMEQIEPMQAIYAITDHIRTLLFAITDGGIPSNIGGGYNLRVILRRSLWFAKEHNLDFDLMEIAEHHAKFLKPMFPELKEGLPIMENILPIEKQKYQSTLDNAQRIVAKMVDDHEKITEEKLIMLYESHGITPEFVGKVAGIEIPDNIYSSITQKHEITETERQKEKIDVTKFPPTRLLFYQDPHKCEFKARVIFCGSNYVILDETCFYPEGGGQESDFGTISGKRVYDVKKIGNVVVHYLENPDFQSGQEIQGKIDWERRKQLMSHHTAIHIIGAASRKILGTHIFQAGTHKSFDKAHLDVTHYKSIGEEEEDKIEEESNKLVEKSVPIKTSFLKRSEAEKKYGLSIYQGGFIPGNDVRIVEIANEDVQACGGTHEDKTSDVGRIVITSTERIQDGVNRITIKAGLQAEKYLQECLEKTETIIESIKGLQFLRLSDKFKKDLKKEAARRQLRDASDVFSVTPSQINETIKRFVREIEENEKEMFSLEARLKIKKNNEARWIAEDLKHASKIIFDYWKSQNKVLENLKKQYASQQAEELLKKAKGDTVLEIVQMDRKSMIDTATAMTEQEPKTTVILVNINGDVICMSRTRDMDVYIKDLIKKTGGSGGGTKELAQGRTDLSKFRKVIESG